MDLRASDAERERTADVLRHAAGEGRLTLEELDERLTTAYAATTRGELEVLTADVVEAHPAPIQGRLPVTGGDQGTSWIVSIMSGSDRRGRWKLGRRVRVINVMGGSDLDLTHAELSAEVTEMVVFSFWGGGDIRVPDGLNVEIAELNLMGGNDIRIGDARPDPGGPTLRLRMISIMGGGKVRRGSRRSRRERRRLRGGDS